MPTCNLLAQDHKLNAEIYSFALCLCLEIPSFSILARSPQKIFIVFAISVVIDLFSFFLADLEPVLFDVKTI